jgi:7,8-dihydropterin-6-yl-methyl-4-(beta-D-ribofuranosyl)aminobenzene 5'-phosphate synthase
MKKQSSLLLGSCLAVIAVTDGLSASSIEAPPVSRTVAEAVSVTILSSNLANGATVGEWGLSALVEADGQCVLFDAGRYPDTVLRNAEALSVDLSCVTDVVLSHFHFDHTTGLLPILRDIHARGSETDLRVHVASGFFLPRRIPSATGDEEWNQMIAMRDSLESEGVRFVEHEGPSEILPSIWVTGSISRPNPERNYPSTIHVRMDGEWIEDFVPDSQGLTVVTPQGHIVLLGCGHSGVVNALEHVRNEIDDLPIHALMGGLHLFAASDEVLGWTGDRLREIGVEHLMAGHCTGIEPLIRLRTALNLSRRTAVVGAVGSQFVYGEGIRPTAIAM